MIYEYDGRFAKKTRLLIDKAMSHVINFLELPAAVTVYVVPSNDEGLTAGGCMQISQYTYEVTINTKQRPAEIVRTIIHEMKHVEQYANKKMTQKSWNNKSIMVYRGVNYFDLPWEKEAYEFEERIWGRFKKI